MMLDPVEAMDWPLSVAAQVVPVGNPDSVKVTW
jgi:hypothetical protein